jgi:hypothetical protein
MRLLVGTILLLISACIAVDGSVTFTEVATKLEEIFAGAGECEQGAIWSILGGNREASCPAFTSLTAALETSDQDAIAAARKTMLELVDVETRFNHLKNMHDQFIDETLERFVFSSSNDQDQYGCTRQRILSVVANGANSGLFNFIPPGAVVGMRSNPECIDSRVFDVVEAIEKYKTAGPEEKEKAVSENEGIVMVSFTLPPHSEQQQDPAQPSDSSTSTHIVLLAISCLAMAIAVPLFVFYFMYDSKDWKPRAIDSPPTSLSEWFVERSAHGGEEMSELI